MRDHRSNSVLVVRENSGAIEIPDCARIVRLVCVCAFREMILGCARIARSVRGMFGRTLEYASTIRIEPDWIQDCARIDRVVSGARVGLYLVRESREECSGCAMKF